MTVAERTQARAQEPLPVDVALSLRGHNGRSPINVSPDAEWVAHTVESEDTVPRGSSRSYSATGFPFAEGNSRMEATLSSLTGEEPIVLGDPEATSWAPVFSPDGERVAFYSDQGGEAGLWVWERATRQARRVGEFVVRPFFGFEGVRWAPDGRRLLVKVLPEGLTIEAANALLPAPNRDEPQPETDPDAPAVTVRRSSAMVAEEAAEDPDAAPLTNDPTMAFIAGNAAALAIVDVSREAIANDADGAGARAERIERIVEREPVRAYAFSPDGGRVAYSVQSSFVPNAQQALFELRVRDLMTGDERVLGRDLKLGYGIEWSWSPDSRRIAYTESGQMAEGAFFVVDVASGTTTKLENDAPRFAAGEGEVPPIWSADASTLWGVADGALWQVDATSGEARKVASIDGWQVRVLVSASWYGTTAFSRDGGRTLWVTAREEDTGRSGLFAVDAASGETRSLREEDGSWGHLFSLAASDATGDVVYVARNQQQVGELWAVSTESQSARQVSRINRDLARYALGQARLLDFRSANGEPLRGALLLPPGWQPGKRLPLVVWVYGGENGSGSLHRFGLWGEMATFNLHLLATRGYAVLYPDAPVRTGRITDDLVAAVLPAVDAAVEQGYADGERVAVMGQSFGSLNVLALLTRSDRFRAAVITAAVLHPDLYADYLRSTGYYEQGQGGMGGTIWEHPERYRQNSPLFDFPRIATPLLVGQGDQDGDLVPANAIFAALERLGKKVELRLYQGESHVISRSANVRDFWERRFEFLAGNLGLEVGADGRVSIPPARAGGF